MIGTVVCDMAMASASGSTGPSDHVNAAMTVDSTWAASSNTC